VRAYEPPGRFLVYISVTCLVEPIATARPEDLGPFEKPKYLSGIELATFPRVAECLNQLRFHLSPALSVSKITPDKFKRNKKN
jgi:hypothetical protein